MKIKEFINYAMNEEHPQYALATKREEIIYQRRHDLRRDFGRDYTRILF